MVPEEEAIKSEELVFPDEDQRETVVEQNILVQTIIHWQLLTDSLDNRHNKIQVTTQNTVIDDTTKAIV